MSFPVLDLTLIKIYLQEYYEFSQFNKIEMTVILSSHPRQSLYQKAVMRLPWWHSG